MTDLERINVGLVGAVGRGGVLHRALEHGGARIHAVCDIRGERIEECRQRLGAAEAYTDYGEMLEQSDLDAVIVGTPMDRHVPQTLMALERGVRVLSEVPAGISIDECRELVGVAGRSEAIYMMAENYIYMRPNMLITEIVRQGLLGTIYYAEGEYLHELRGLNEQTPWRRIWQTGITGITYGTHSLGPILQWLPGDRVERVCCENSGTHLEDPRGDAYAQDTAVMLAKTAKGVLIKIRVDMVSDRPHAMTNYQLQGTDGVYESDRCDQLDTGRIWFRKLSDEVRWHDIASLMHVRELKQKYLPAFWRDPPPEAVASGHGGGDYFEVLDWLRSIRGEIACPIGIHAAMDITLPGLVSQQSITQGGEWLPVPDSRDWAKAE